MNNKRSFKGIWIPKEIWLSKDLTLQEKVFLVEIDSLDNDDGCYANNQYFATFFGLSKSRVSVVINKLIEKKFITSEIKHKDGKLAIDQRILRIAAPVNSERGIPVNGEGGIPESREGGIPESREGGIPENGEDNNTSINNTNKGIDDSKNKNKKSIPKTEQTSKQQKEKNPPVAKHPPLYVSMVDVWATGYEDKIGVKPDFTAEDGRHIKEIIKKFKYTLGQKEPDPSDIKIEYAFKYFLNNLPNWYGDKLSLRMIVADYNKIIAEIKTNATKKTRSPLLKSVDPEPYYLSEKDG